MKKTKYQPKAGDVCEWNWLGDIREVMIIAPESFDNDGYYEAIGYNVLGLGEVAEPKS